MENALRLQKELRGETLKDFAPLDKIIKDNTSSKPRLDFTPLPLPSFVLFFILHRYIRSLTFLLFQWLLTLKIPWPPLLTRRATKPLIAEVSPSLLLPLPPILTVLYFPLSLIDLNLGYYANESKTHIGKPFPHLPIPLFLILYFSYSSSSIRK